MASKRTGRGPITGPWIMERIIALAGHSEQPDQITRTYLTPAQKAAGEMLIGWMRETGMSARFDAAGNVIGRYEGTDPTAPAIMIGSHYDTVINAGRFDGPYGVVAALAVVHTLYRQGRRPRAPIEVVAFAEEEGVRFKSTLIGSRAIAGTLDPDIVEARDAQGIRLGDALAAFHGSMPDLATAARNKGAIGGFIELHIEQGPVLADEGLPVGVVTGIAGASRFSIAVHGQAGHTGTVPMSKRRDAAAGAAEFILAVGRRGSGVADLVGTVGVVSTPGGAANVIPGLVEMTLDVRAATDRHRLEAIRDIRDALRDIGKRRGLRITMTKTHDARAVQCDGRLQAALSGAIEARGLPVRSLPSGAGHDTMAMASLCPAAMLFVRCGHGGISHDPRETMTAADAAIGANVLLDAVTTLAA